MPDSATFFPPFSRIRMILSACIMACTLTLAACQTPWSAESEPGAYPVPEGEKGAVSTALLIGARDAKKRGDFTAAAGQFGKLHAIHPNTPDILIDYMDSLRMIGASRDAYRLSRDNHERLSDNPAFLLASARAALSQGESEIALEDLEAARQLQDRDWRVYSLMGIAYDGQGEFDKAIAAYRTALELSPGNRSVSNNMALSMAQAGDLDGAIQLLRKLTSHPDGGNTRIRQNLAILYGFKGDLTDLEALARMDLSDEMVKNNLEVFGAVHANKGGQ